MRRLDEAEVASIQAEAASQDGVGEMWRRVIAHADAHGGVIADVLRATYGPLWGDHYVRPRPVVAYMLDLSLSDVRQIIEGTPHSPADAGGAVDGACHRDRAPWFVSMQAREEELLAQARTENWTADRLGDAWLHAFQTLRPEH